jgi:hypothetical protein
MRRKAVEIIAVKGPDIRVSDPFTGKRSDYGNYVRVAEVHYGRATGKEHVFINGSINQIAPENREVGKRGFISWSNGLPYFSVK